MKTGGPVKTCMTGFLILVLALGGAGQQQEERRPSAKDSGPSARSGPRKGRPDPFAPLIRKKVEKAAPKKTAGKPEPVVETGLTLADLHLTSILWTGRSQMAVINDSLIRIGGRVGGWVVVAISRDTVIVVKDGRRERLSPEKTRKRDTPPVGTEGK